MVRKVCVLGMGYIGLPTSIMFASNGYEVMGVDINEGVVEKLNQGMTHIEEPGLDSLLGELVAGGKLKAAKQPCKADIYIIAVPTPITWDNKADLSYVQSATESIAPYVTKGNAVIVESTVSPGTTEDLVGGILKRQGFRVGEDIYLAHCPERVLPGKVLEELINNSRIVGGVNEKSGQHIANIYRAFVKGNILLTDARTAEMAKLMENTFRDVNIALANELAMVCNHLNIDVLKAIELANFHPRVNFLQPGPGVGGHCLAVDPYFIVEQAPEKAKLIATARAINNDMPGYVVSKVNGLLFGINNAKIAVLGLTYKGNINDCRESPALEITRKLISQGYEIAVVDPHLKAAPFPLVSIQEALTGAHCALILADHNEFKTLDTREVRALMCSPLIFDTKNCLIQVDDPDVIIVNLGNLERAKSQEFMAFNEVAVSK